MKSLASYLVPPRFEDPEQYRQAYWLNRYLLAFDATMMLLLVLIRPLSRFSGFEQTAALLGLVCLFSLGLVCTGLVYFGRIRLAAWLLCAVSFAIITGLMCVFEGIRSSSVVGYFVIVSAVSLFIRGQAPLLFMVLNVSALTLVYMLEQNGIVVSSFGTRSTIDDLVILSAGLVLNTLLLRQLIEGLSTGVADAHCAADALQVANEELKQSQALLKQLHHELEARVAARTAELQIANAQLQHEVGERKRTEEAMQQAQKRESLGLMASAIAHDFNNLLVAMLAQNNLAMRKLPPHEAAREHLQKAVLAAEQAADLTRQMLAYAGGSQLEMEPVNLNRLIEKNIHLFRAAIAKHVLLHTDLAAELPLIEADRSQLQQVIMNLILNGAEAVAPPSGDVWVTTGLQTLTTADAPYWHWTGSALPPGEYVFLTVHDNGVGMTPEIRSRIFDPFFTTKEDGQGLGLASVLGIVRDHRGGLQVESQLGQGTTFRLVFPKSQRAETAVIPHQTAAPSNAADLCILVIDDEAPVREAVTDIMALHGVEVMTAVNGQEGVATFARYKDEIRLVLLDMSMPGMNGLDTLIQLRQVDPTVRIILSSGYAQQQIAPEVKVNGLTGFLPKPYDVNTLVSKVWHYLSPSPQD
ncbi:MAG: response regulator [Anaerolineaceae bacterium]|nr:response regulator [Anaerolineaceae bacterium]